MSHFISHSNIPFLWKQVRTLHRLPYFLTAKIVVYRSKILKRSLRSAKTKFTMGRNLGQISNYWKYMKENKGPHLRIVTCLFLCLTPLCVSARNIASVEAAFAVHLYSPLHASICFIFALTTPGGNIKWQQVYKIIVLFFNIYDRLTQHLPIYIYRFSIRRVMLLEFSQYLENYLWKNYTPEKVKIYKSAASLWCR